MNDEIHTADLLLLYDELYLIQKKAQGETTLIEPPVVEEIPKVELTVVEEIPKVEAAVADTPKIELIPIPSTPKPEEYLLLGKLDSKTLVFVDEEHFSQQHPTYSLLQKIMVAVKLNETDYAILKDGTLALECMKSEKQLLNKKSIVFTNHEPRNLPYYKLVSKSGTSMVGFPSLSKMAESKEIKAQVWAVLQELFLK